MLCKSSEQSAQNTQRRVESEVFSRSVKYGLFSCMIYSTVSYRYKGPLWFMPCGTTMNSIVNSQVLRQVTLHHLIAQLEVATRQRPDTFQQVYEKLLYCQQH
ncbi:Hypothetical_protein [Hexamita inflata]|uniref:Hypothetical_protein n=1 Tax=Hexamita inflata TaxID=28002 RepID=A0ABP1JXL6_9EUKA